MNADLHNSDEELVVYIRNGNMGAFKILYDRYSKKLYYFSLKHLCVDEEAKELVQSVFINIWEHRGSLDKTMSIKNYLYKSAVNYIYNCMKRKAVRTKYIESEIRKGEPYSDQTYENLFLHDLERSIVSIVDNMPAQQQRIFQLSRYSGLSHEEIAVKLDLSVRTVENHIYRALKLIKSKLKNEILLLLIFSKTALLSTFL